MGCESSSQANCNEMEVDTAKINKGTERRVAS